MFASKTKIILPPNMNKSPLVKMYEKPVYKDFFKPKSRVQSIKNQYHRLSSKKPKTTSEPPVEANSEPNTNNKPPVEANSEPTTTDESLVEETPSENQNIANDQKIEDANKAVEDAEKKLELLESVKTLSDNKAEIGKLGDDLLKKTMSEKFKLKPQAKNKTADKKVVPIGGKTKTRKIKKKGIKK